MREREMCLVINRRSRTMREVSYKQQFLFFTIEVQRRISTRSVLVPVESRAPTKKHLKCPNESSYKKKHLKCRNEIQQSHELEANIGPKPGF